MTSVDGIIFFGLNIIAAVSIWYFAKARQYSHNRLFFGQTWLPATLLLFIFFSAYMNGNPANISLEVKRLHIPIADIKQPQRETYFIAGDAAIGSDLVVRPFFDKALSDQVAEQENNPLVWIEAERRNDSVATYICFGGYAPNREFSLPGMYVKTGTDDTDAAPNYDRRCEALDADQEPRSVSIYTQEVGTDDATDIERRSFSVERGQTGGDAQYEAVTINLNTGMRANLQSCNATALRMVPAVEYADDIAFLPPDNLQFSALGTGGKYPLLNSDLLGVPANPESFCRSDAANFAWPVQVDGDVGFGGPRISGNVRRTLLSWFPVIFVLISCCFMHLVRTSAWASNPIERTIIFALHWLLAVRILVGNEGLFFDTKSDVALVFWDILGLYSSLPVIACALLMKGGKHCKNSVIALAVFLLGTVLAIGLWLDAFLPNLEMLIIILLALSALGARFFIPLETPLILALTPDGHTLRLWVAKQRIIGKIVNITKWLRQIIQPVIGALLSKPWGRAGLFLLVLMVIRISLVAFGWLSGISPLKERIGPLPISLFYVPLVIFGFAYLVAAYRKTPDCLTAFVILVLGALGLAVALITSDLGSLLLHLWPVLVLVGFCAVSGTRIWSLKAGKPLLIVVALLPFSLFAWGLVLAHTPIATVDEGLIQHMASVLEWKRMDARLLYYIAPARVDELGTLVAFEMRDFSAAIDPLVTGLTGRGYLVNADIPSGLLRYQFNDNLSAIHLMLPFGRLGITGFIIFIFALAAALWTRGGHSEQEQPFMPLHFASNAALFTLLWAAIYMTLAHLNLVPFTGRNIYFLAVTSGGDALESLILLLIGAAAPLSLIYKNTAAKGGK